MNNNLTKALRQVSSYLSELADDIEAGKASYVSGDINMYIRSDTRTSFNMYGAIEFESNPEIEIILTSALVVSRDKDERQ